MFLPLNPAEVRVDREDVVRTAAHERQRPESAVSDVEIEQDRRRQRVQLFWVVVELQLPQELKAGLLHALFRNLPIGPDPRRALCIVTARRPIPASPPALGARHAHPHEGAAKIDGEKASIVSEPLYWMVLSAANVSFQFTAPFPGVLRSFSETCTWIRTSAQRDSASVMSFSSMLAWKVSYIMRKLAWLTSLTIRAASAEQFRR